MDNSGVSAQHFSVERIKSAVSAIAIWHVVQTEDALRVGLEIDRVNIIQQRIERQLTWQELHASHDRQTGTGVDLVRSLRIHIRIKAAKSSAPEIAGPEMSIWLASTGIDRRAGHDQAANR